MSSFTHLGYPGNAPTPTLAQAPVTSSASPKSPPGSPCCETGRPIMTDPVTGQTVCSCQYGPAAASLYAGVYPRVPGLPEALYSQTALAQGLLPHLAMSPTAAEPSMYTGLTSPYDFKGLATAGGLYSYDPSLAAYPYAAGFLDPNARRKNATRESTQTLKAWLSEHKKNPYPTKGEKIMLAIITKMTLTQVSTWFANARRRLKKENKMTWEPRNRMDEDDEDDVRSDEDEEEGTKKGSPEDKLEDENISVDSDDEDDPSQPRNFTSAALLAHANSVRSGHHHHHPLLFAGRCPVNGSPLAMVSRTTEGGLLMPTKDSSHHSLDAIRKSSGLASPSSLKTSTESDSPKPKIWSMAEIATSSKDSSNNSSSHNNTENNNNNTTTTTSTAAITSSSSNTSSSSIRPPHLITSANLLASQTLHHHQGKMPSALAQGLHPAWRGAAHPYLHPHFAQRLAAFPGAAVPGQTPPRHMLPAFTSLPQLRHNDGSRISAFSPPSSATSPSAQADRNV